MSFEVGSLSKSLQHKVVEEQQQKKKKTATKKQKNKEGSATTADEGEQKEEEKKGEKKNEALWNIFSSAEEKSKKAWEEVKSAQKSLTSSIANKQGRYEANSTTTTTTTTTPTSNSKQSKNKRSRPDEDAGADDDEVDERTEGDGDHDDEDSRDEDDSDDENFDVYRNEPELSDLQNRGDDEEVERDNEGDEEDKDDEEEKKEKDGKKVVDKQLEMEKNERTIFIGNLPLSFNKKKLKRVIVKCIDNGEEKLRIAKGEKETKQKIESIRFRSIAFATQNTPRKYAFANQQFHPERDSMNGYAVLDSVQTAKCACVGGNNMLVDDKHIRVDIATNKTHDTRFCIFVGNLPFEVEDEKVRKHFEGCGQIKSVRLIRDKTTNLGKGIGYIGFQHYEGFKAGMSLDGSQFQNRRLRIQPVEKETKKMTSRTAAHKNNPYNASNINKDKRNKKSDNSGSSSSSSNKPWEGQKVDAKQARRQLKKTQVRKEIKKSKKKESNPKRQKTNY